MPIDEAVGWKRLWTMETSYVDCTPKQYRDFVLERGDSIMLNGHLRQLVYRKIAPGVIRVSKAQDGKCGLCGHKL